MQEEERQVESAVVRCDACGAEMLFDPEKGKLSCPYCGSEREIQKRVPMLRDVLAEKDLGEVINGSDAYRCPNCGGVVDFEGLDTAKACPFCGATNVVKLQDIQGLKPDSILPFKISKDRAAELFKAWSKRKLFAPKLFKKLSPKENFSGTYIPSFAFNSDTYSAYEGKFGKNRTRTVGSGKNAHTETYIEWYHVSGRHDRAFNNVVVEASSELTQDEIEMISPYDIDLAEAYTREYISGFSAQRYDNSLDDCYNIAQDKMGDAIKREIIAEYHPDHVAYLNVDTDFENNKFRYTMLPLWICVVLYKNKPYRYIVNGRTGRGYGKAPVSPAKASVFAAAIVAVVAAIVLLFLHFAGII